MYGRYRDTSNLNHLWIIMVLNLIVFIGTMISRDLIYLLGLSAATFPVQPWTIITSMFTHASLWHIFANMLTLYFFGSFLTRLLGMGKVLAIYLCGGIVGGIFYLLLSPPFTIAIGASGAVFALGGTLTLLAPKLKVMAFPIPVPIPLWAAILGGFLILSLFPGIAWQAHLGGLIVGLVAGFFLRKRVPPLRF